MFGLTLRLVILAAVVFGVVRGIMAALRTQARRRAEREIRAELRAVELARHEGLLDAREQDALTRAIYARCRQEGIDVDADADADTHTDADVARRGQEARHEG